MSSNRWTNRIFPPLVIVAVVGGVWVAVSNRTEEANVSITSEASPTVAHASTTPKTEAAAEPLETPKVEKLPGKLKFTVDTKKVSKVQKVEFYVSNRLVGAAYTQPFTVSVDETILQPGSHTVVAKVYTESATKDTPPAGFVSAATPGVKPNSDAIAPSNPSTGQSAPTETPPAPTPPLTVGAPTGVVANIIGGPSIQVSWNAPSGSPAGSYQIWRDGIKITTTAGTSYIDTAVTTGQTYDYYVISVGSSGVLSEASETVAATVPTPPEPDGGSGAGPSDLAPDNKQPDNNGSE